MSDAILASIISIVGVLISVNVSILVTRLQNKSELEKLKREQEQQYAKSLFEKRIDVYPELYNLFSSLAKMIRDHQATVKNLIEFTAQNDSWNSRHSIFFTEATKKVSYKFRAYLHDLLRDGRNSNIKDEDWNAIIRMLIHFETCLRTEIGVTSTAAAGELAEMNKVYDFIDQRRGQISKTAKT
jgi:hypothetical protein